jgi:hypothetical protein
VLVPLLVGLVFVRHARLVQPTLLIEDGALIVKTRAREVYPVADITALSLEARFPEVERKDEGLDRGGRLSGRFMLRGLGRSRVAVNTASPPFIIVRTATAVLVLNFPEPERTRALYAALQRERQKVSVTAHADGH